MFPTGVSVLGNPDVAQAAMGEVTHYANKTSFMRRQSGLDYIYKTWALENGGVTHVVENEYVRLVYVDVRGVPAAEESVVRRDEDDETFIDHGIGIAFTAPDDEIVPGFERLAADGTPLGIPQPVVLIEKTNPDATGFLRGTGEWRAVRVKELWGGNSVWVNADRTEWFTVFADEWHRPPDVNQSSTSYYWRAGWFGAEGQLEEYQRLWPGPHLAGENFDFTGQLGSVARSRYGFTGRPRRRPSVRLITEAPYAPMCRLPNGKICVLVGETVRQGYGEPASTLRIYHDDPPTGEQQYGLTLVAEITYDAGDALLPSFEHLHINRAGTHAVCMVQPIEGTSVQVRYEQYAVVDLTTGVVTITATPSGYSSTSSTDHGSGAPHTLTSTSDRTESVLAYYDRDDVLRFVVEETGHDILEQHDASHFDMSGGGTRFANWTVGTHSYTMRDESWEWVTTKENVGTEGDPDWESYWVSRSGSNFQRWCMFFDPLHDILVFAEETAAGSMGRYAISHTPSCAITVFKDGAQVYSHPFTVGSGSLLVNDQGVISSARRPQLDTSAYSAIEPATGSLMLVLQNDAIDWATTLIFDAAGMKTLADVLPAAPAAVKVAESGNLTNFVSI